MLVAWMLWMWARNPNLRIGIGSATGKHGEDVISELQSHIMSNERFRWLFGDWYCKGGWTKKGFNLGTRTAHYKNNSCETFSVGKDVTGAHYDIIVLDDVAIRDNSETATMREKQIKLYKDCLDLVVNDQEKPFLDKQDRKGVIVVFGTRWHFGDIYNYLRSIANRSLDFLIDWPLMRNPEIEEADPERWRSRIKELLKHPKTVLLAPGMFDIKYAKDTFAEKGTFEFSCQQMNYPTSDEGATFKAEDLCFMKMADVPGNLKILIVVDTAGDKSTYERADDWASLVVGVEPAVIGGVPTSRLYILDVVAKSNISSNEFLGIISQQALLHGPHRVGIEKNFSQTYINILREQYPHLRNKIVSILATRNKHLKILGLQPYVENGNLIIVEDDDAKEVPFIGRTLKLSEGKEKLVNQLTDYGNTDHEDCIDALSNILELLKPPKKRVEQKYRWDAANPKTGY